MTRYWEPGTQYNYNDVVEYEGHRYKIVQPHRSQGDWTPPITPALWGRLSDDCGSSNNDCNQGYQPQHCSSNNDCGDKNQQHQGYQPQQSYQPPQQPPQYGQQHDNKPDKPVEQHWYENDDTKKKIGIGAGLLVGAGALGAGVLAYKKHEEHKEEEKAQGWAQGNWINEARARTDAYRRQGGNEPAAWVLTHGKSIPNGAILVGREHSWNLYFSRSYHDGALALGKASDAFQKGGVIGYKNDEIHVEDFEVLVGDINRLRWVPLSGKFHLSDLGYRPVEGGHESDGTRTYVAKAPHKGVVHPGKVGDGWDGVYIPYDGDEKLIKEYQVLCYDEKRY